MVDGVLEAERLQRAAPGLRFALRLAVTDSRTGLRCDWLGMGVALWGVCRAHGGLQPFPAVVSRDLLLLLWWRLLQVH